jgi:type IX secretion system PorP/SprF family membrane protein
MKSKLAVFIFILINISFDIYAQDPIYSQFYYNKLDLNPAFAGNEGNSSGKIRLNAYNRNLFLPIRGPFNSQNASIDIGLCKFPIGIGFIVSNEFQGDGNYRITKFDGIISVNIPLMRTQRFSIGLKSGIINQYIDWNEFIFSDQLNPIYGVVSQSSNTGNVIDNSIVNNWTAGLKYYNFDSEKIEYSIGVIASNLFEPAIGFLNRSILPRRYTAHFIIKLRKKGNTEEKSVRLSIRADKQNSFITSIISAEYYFDKSFSLGGGKRLSFFNDNALKNTTSISLFAGWQRKDNIKVIFSYETNIGGINLLGAGNSFELGINYLIPKSFCKKRSSYMDCPNVQ